MREDNSSKRKPKMQTQQWSLWDMLKKQPGGQMWLETTEQGREWQKVSLKKEQEASSEGP